MFHRPLSLLPIASSTNGQYSNDSVHHRGSLSSSNNARKRHIDSSLESRAPTECHTESPHEGRNLYANQEREHSTFSDARAFKKICLHGDLSSRQKYCNAHNEGELLQHLAVKANECIRKGTYLERVKNPEKEMQCEDIAKDMVDLKDLLPKISMKHLSMLADAFSKFPGNDACEKACEAIAGEILNRLSSEPKNLSEQDLVSFAYMLSNFPQNQACENVCDQIASEALKRLSSNKKVFDEQGLTNLASAFVIFPNSTDCLKAFEVIKSGVIKQIQDSKNGCEFSAKALFRFAVAFSKEGGGNSQAISACGVIAAEISQRLESRKKAEEFQTHQLATLAEVFSRYTNSKDCQDSAKAIMQKMLTRNIKKLCARDLCTLVQGCSSLAQNNVDQADRVLKKVVSEISWRMESREKAEEFQTHELATLAEVFSRYTNSKDCQDGAKLIVNEVLRRGTKTFSTEDLLTLLQGFNSFAQRNIDRADRAFEAIASEVRDRIPKQSSETRYRFTTQALSSFADIFSKKGDEKDSQAIRACGVIASEVCERMGSREKAEEFQPHELATLTKAFSRCVNTKDCRDGGQVLAQQVLTRDIKTFYAKDLCTLAQGFSRFAQNNLDQADRALKKVASEVSQRMESPEEMRKFTDTELSTLLGEFNKFSGSEACQSASKAVTLNILTRMIDAVAERAFNK